jgi:hypothetical protein
MSAKNQWQRERRKLARECREIWEDWDNLEQDKQYLTTDCPECSDLCGIEQ